MMMTLTNGLPTMARSICGKVCKNKRGLKLHQTKMKCMVQESTAQHTEDTPQCPEPPSAKLFGSRQSSSAASDQVACGKPAQIIENFDEDTARIITTTAKGDADKQLQTMTTIRFGFEECKTNRPNYTMNRRADKICQLRQELWQGSSRQQLRRNHHSQSSATALGRNS